MRLHNKFAPIRGGLKLTPMEDRTRGLFLSVKGSNDCNFIWIPSFAVGCEKSAQHWMHHNSRTKGVMALYDASMDSPLYKLSIDIWVGYENFT